MALFRFKGRKQTRPRAPVLLIDAVAAVSERHSILGATGYHAGLAVDTFAGIEITPF
jgi:hypothetical protein